MPGMNISISIFLQVTSFLTECISVLTIKPHENQYSVSTAAIKIDKDLLFAFYTRYCL